jgi:hypothetical protein
MNPSIALQTEEPGIGNDSYYAFSAVSPNANHQDKTSSLFTIDRIAKPLPNSAQTLEDPHFEEPESQEPFFDCITYVWHKHIRLFARELEEYSNEAHLSAAWQQFNILRLFFKTKMMKSLTMNPQMMMMSIHAFRTLQRPPLSRKIFLECFLTVQLSTGCLKFAMIQGYVFVHVQSIPVHEGQTIMIICCVHPIRPATQTYMKINLID